MDLSLMNIPKQKSFKIEVTVFNAPYFNYYNILLFIKLMTHFPYLVIVCRIDKDKRENKNSGLVIDGDRYLVDSFDTFIRTREEIRLETYIKYLQSKSSKIEDMSPELNFFNGNRELATRRLQKASDCTFCIRAASKDELPDDLALMPYCKRTILGHDFILSYKINSTIHHSTISQWEEQFYFHEDSNNKEIAGVFFSRISSFAWYWETHAFEKNG